MDQKTIRKTVHYLLLVATIVMVVSGLGITEYRTIGPLTLGVLGKGSSFQVHILLWLPFVILFVLHFYLIVARKKG